MEQALNSLNYRGRTFIWKFIFRPTTAAKDIDHLITKYSNTLKVLE